jgi:hypothetical protein
MMPQNDSGNRSGEQTWRELLLEFCWDAKNLEQLICQVKQNENISKANAGCEKADYAEVV